MIGQEFPEKEIQVRIQKDKNLASTDKTLSI
jgi:hypothetical protein